MALTFDLTVPTPCEKGKNEWNQSLKTEKGVFCQHCSTEVIDFSDKTPHEIKAFFKNYKGNVCGKFFTEQLTTYKAMEYKPVFVKRFVLSGLLSLPFAAKNHAETVNPVQQVNYSPEITKKESLEVGKSVEDSVEIRGRFLEKSKSNAIFNLKVGLMGTNFAVLTGSSGEFILKVSRKILLQHDTLFVEAGYYETFTRIIKLESEEAKSYNLGDVYLKTEMNIREVTTVGKVAYQPDKKRKGFLKQLFGKKD